MCACVRVCACVCVGVRGWVGEGVRGVCGCVGVGVCVWGVCGCGYAYVCMCVGGCHACPIGSTKATTLHCSLDSWGYPVCVGVGMCAHTQLNQCTQVPTGSNSSQVITSAPLN